jgi:dolichol-phosphate mannosyltransferase
VTADPSVSVVIPVFNNATSLEELIARLAHVLGSRGAPYEIVLVDDGSKDASWDIITRAARADDHVVGVKLSRNFGQHPAIRAGLERASGDATVLMDADLQDRPEALPAMLDALVDDVDVVFTTWVAPDDEVRERVSSRVFHSVFARFAGVNMPRNVGTLRVFTRDYRQAVLDYPEGAAVYGPLMAQMGYTAAWVEVVRDLPSGRKSSYNFRKRSRLAVNTLLTYSDLPYRAVSWLGIGLVAASFVYVLLLIAQYLIDGRSVPSGITLVLTIQLLLSGAVLICLGVLGAYLFRIFREVLRRPPFHVARHAGVGLPRMGRGAD